MRALRFAAPLALAALFVVVTAAWTSGDPPPRADADAMLHATVPSPPATAPHAEGRLRVCVLSKDMPLSSEDADAEGRTGLYLDLARAMAERLQQTTEIYFTQVAFYKRPVREGLLAGKCDAYFGLPRGEGDWFIPQKVALTQPLTEIGFVVATTDGQRVTSLDDLKGKVVAVQGGSPAAIAVSMVDGIETLTSRDPLPALEALAAGEADAAFVWGPQAGYYNEAMFDGAFTITPTAMRWPVAIGVRAEDREALVPQFNDLIGQMQGTIEDLRATYGLPTGETISVPFPGRTFTGTASSR
jgi:ABC-type amino acid transport substrate-binding protein